jgi:hypothetical protein
MYISRPLFAEPALPTTPSVRQQIHQIENRFMHIQLLFTVRKTAFDPSLSIYLRHLPYLAKILGSSLIIYAR